MCTLTWRYDETGYTVGFSRDERRSRAIAAPPIVRRRADVAYLAPTDTDAFGTWIATNEFGVTLCLLNGYGDGAQEPVGGWRSRGDVVVDLALATTARDALERSATLDFARARPFVLAVFEDSSGPHLVEWDGRARRTSTHVDGPPLVSSSFDADAVRAARVDLFRRMPLHDSGLERFHESHEPEPGPTSVCMHRADASTVSLSVVHVGPRATALRYRAGAPCDPMAVESRVTLERRGPAC